MHYKSEFYEVYTSKENRQAKLPTSVVQLGGPHAQDKCSSKTKEKTRVYAAGIFGLQSFFIISSDSVSLWFHLKD